ncbi:MULTISPECIES: hypothetical protein [Pseudoalteromonas]|uniref:hypothetical protein n=1 Tax=Pseudoalteromonas TaxID=53246 RepID=UPI000F64D0D2|nr:MULTISPECIES: hypothetical protein [Pseudoalteromonas]MDW7551122.1 hypothetical protein [Pseudoalteromonas peptidolytica]RRS10260.1 hypothetical protein EAG18_01505 [Pseudoalteromonas sp. J010]RXF00772.1 hypothetical protein D9603_14620 [Pseudoalteromonas sp. PS5]USD28311.1 hypothetical protein J8Z24_15585 [Pseudoalteromonas sp. SCSIO 43201]
MQKLSIALFTLLSSTTVLADDTSPFSFSATAGVSLGGDTIGTLVYEDNSDDTVKAGDGIFIGGGIHYQANKDFDIKLNALYHFDAAEAKNGDLTFSRWAFEAIPYYNLNDNVKLGAGIGFDTSVELDSDFTLDAKFNNTTKLIFSGLYAFNYSQISLELRYEVAEYEVSSVGNLSIPSNIANTHQLDGNRFAALVHWNF